QKIFAQAALRDMLEPATDAEFAARSRGRMEALLSELTAQGMESGVGEAEMLADLIANAGVEAYNGMMARPLRPAPAGKETKFRDEVRADVKTTFGVALEMTANMVKQTEGWSGQEQTGFSQIHRLAAHIDELSGAVVEVEYDERMQGLSEAMLLRELAKNAGLDEAAVNELLGHLGKKIFVRVRKAGEKIDVAQVRGLLNVQNLDIFAMDAAHWVVPQEWLKSGVVRLLVMLAGDVVTNATQKLHEDIQRVQFIRIQA
ncbi:MAG TPA: hypothetical protein P5079_09060, partial [Elusimicrobiota bacterium]|nr:hypothetical protein [Elusimicrobiota bacterium]